MRTCQHAWSFQTSICEPLLLLVVVAAAAAAIITTGANPASWWFCYDHHHRHHLSFEPPVSCDHPLFPRVPTSHTPQEPSHAQRNHPPLPPMPACQDAATHRNSCGHLPDPGFRSCHTQLVAHTGAASCRSHSACSSSLNPTCAQALPSCYLHAHVCVCARCVCVCVCVCVDVQKYAASVCRLCSCQNSSTLPSSPQLATTLYLHTRGPCQSPTFRHSKPTTTATDLHES